MTEVATLDVGAADRNRHATPTLIAALLGFFTITLDAVVVNMTLPTIRHDLGGGVAGLQWVVDGYTLMFAALLLTAGSLSDRLGAKRSVGGGMALFLLASVACGPAPTLGVLVAVGLLPSTAPLGLLSGLMVLVGLGGPTVSPPATAVLLDTVLHHQAGVASGVFNTSRQIGGPLAIAVFGGLLTNLDTFVRTPATATAICDRCSPSQPPPPPFASVRRTDRHNPRR